MRLKCHIKIKTKINKNKNIASIYIKNVKIKLFA